ncbi:VOC family protein [Cellulomonas sp. P22]|uniref:VOC family protein n=1 Tax=Cellulomonas sp. P22 TaxID=3373189 RepID=UPI0037996C1A
MDPRLTLITLGVADVEAARRFYVDGLGWDPAFDVPGQVLFLQVGPGVLLSFFGAQDLAADMGDARGSAPATPQGVTLAHNVDSPAAVDAAIARAVAAGARVVKPAQRAEWGGYHGYVEDPCGVRWEIAHNSGLTIAADGTVSLGAVE